jgi:hypothetical protein
MISLASDCLLFETARGEGIPLSAEMISVELSGDNAGMFDSEFVKHATGAVFHYFKHELGRHMITVGEFAAALEKVLRGFEVGAAPPREPAAKPAQVESDLRRLVYESGNGGELFFFPRLRDELRHQLQQAPRTVRFRGLRGCVKQLAGARRWCARCRTLHEQIVDFLRGCLTVESDRKDCALFVD